MCKWTRLIGNTVYVIHLLIYTETLKLKILQTSNYIPRDFLLKFLMEKGPVGGRGVQGGEVAKKKNISKVQSNWMV